MKTLKFVFAVFLSIIAIGSALVYGENIVKTIQVTYRNISIQVNGKMVPSEQEPFIYQGRTFVPLRTIGEALGKTVEWDNGKNQVVINDAVDNLTRLSSYYELLSYLPDHYKYSISSEKLTQDELSKIEEFWKSLNPKENEKWDFEKHPIKSYQLKSSSEEFNVFIAFGITTIRYKDKTLYYIRPKHSRLIFCASSDGWISSKEIRNDAKSDEEFYFLDYLNKVNLSVLKDTPNRSKQITDLYAIQLWIHRFDE
jgi:hypothetical protein